MMRPRLPPTSLRGWWSFPATSEDTVALDPEQGLVALERAVQLDVGYPGGGRQLAAGHALGCILDRFPGVQGADRQRAPLAVDLDTGVRLRGWLAAGGRRPGP